MAIETSGLSKPSELFDTTFATRTRLQTIAVCICLAGIAVLVIQSLQAADGNLNYTLDDPYIHLALAENLLQGHYGVNVEEYASPSSSIIYPFLVAAALAIGLSHWAPLVLNIIGAAGAAWVLAGLFWDAAHKTNKGHVTWIAILTLPVLLIAMNGYALSLTGMEHTLHVWASLAIIRGLILIARTGTVPTFLLIACIAAPLLRFEGAALSGAALLALCFTGHWRAGLSTGAILVACFAAYISLMTSLGLPLMPSSVMVKSGTAEAIVGNRLDALTKEIMASFRESLLVQRQGTILALLIVALIAGTFKADKTVRTVACVAAAAGVAHLLVGSWNWFSRYEIYIIATLIATNLHVWAPVISNSERQITAFGVFIFVFPVIGIPYAIHTALTPKAAHNIYEQQFQMHRFATEYFPERVAVNDLGWVTYDNDQYVLDLWGLGNETARTTFIAEGHKPAPIRRITTNADVAYAMLYEEWFEGGIPEEWCLIGQLETMDLTAAHATVEFYLIEPSLETDMRDAMDSFTQTLPEQVSFQTFHC